MPERIVVALGGNALGNTPEQQRELVRGTAVSLADLVEKGFELVIGHGNGPQVGMINLAMEYSSQKGGGTPFMPFPECGAMTQGYIFLCSIPSWRRLFRFGCGGVEEFQRLTRYAIFHGSREGSDA